MSKTLIFVLATLIFLSACRKQEARVIINAPIETVWSYTGDSSHAVNWSIFFDHISPLPGIPDGEIGALRRCYRRADETGVTWDERVVSKNPPYTRQIRTFNLQGIHINKIEKLEFDVVHTLRSLGPNQTELTFSSEVAESDITLNNLIPLLKVGKLGGEIVQKNVENIKMLIEAKGDIPAELHPFLDKDIKYLDRK